MTTVKMVAVDMDGTFLDDNKQYNRSRFLACYQQLTARDIKFVVASGNQYYQLKSFFSGGRQRYRLCGGKRRMDYRP